MYNVQFVHLNNYCIQMKWWNEGKNFRYFLLAHCCLYSEDIDKSVNFFLKASLNLEHNLVLRRFLNFNDLKDDQVSIGYFLKIIHCYDINGNIDAIIDLIDKAILCCKSEANRSRLYCILFKSYMDLEYYENAFETLMINSDIEWKRNCLKQFIIELCNQNKAIELIKFDYSHMQEFVKEILYQRAKSADLRTHDYYGLLYSFYLKNEDYRKAASFMYEYAIRLKNEMNGMQSLKKQEICYLTCLNTLKLVNKEFSFISIPSKLMLATKGQVNGEVLVEFDEINRNYLIVHYILKISSLSSGQSSIGKTRETRERKT
jgi:tetratricopeptide (TPR) repeat protein